MFTRLEHVHVASPNLQKRKFNVKNLLLVDMIVGRDTR